MTGSGVSPDWSAFGALVAVFAVVLPVGVAPLLVSERVRALLRWPTGRVVANYLLLWIFVIPLHFLGFGAVAAVDERVAAVLGTGDLLLDGLWTANFVVPAVLIVVAVAVLRRRDAMPPESYDVLPFVIVWYGGVAFAATVLYALLVEVGALPS